MNFTEIVILDYIDTWQQEAHVYVHTKDKRILAVHDVVSNPTLDNNILHMEYIQYGTRMNFVLPRDDFSHLEYYYKDKPITKEDFDELNSFIDEQITCQSPPDLLTEPDEGLFEDLI